MNEEYYKEVINDYIEGRASIKGDHPEEVMVALDTFFHAGKMLMDNPEIDTVPKEYVNNLLRALNKHPQYEDLLKDLLDILNKYR
tara:strand:- start:383 stop:637 length:255 start_codon:yes stop_codon:yes gene_type:complete